MNFYAVLPSGDPKISSFSGIKVIEDFYWNETIKYRYNNKHPHKASVIRLYPVFYIFSYLDQREWVCGVSVEPTEEMFSSQENGGIVYYARKATFHKPERWDKPDVFNLLLDVSGAHENAAQNKKVLSFLVNRRKVDLVKFFLYKCPADVVPGLVSKGLKDAIAIDSPEIIDLLLTYTSCVSSDILQEAIKRKQTSCLKAFLKKGPDIFENRDCFLAVRDLVETTESSSGVPMSDTALYDAVNDRYANATEINMAKDKNIHNTLHFYSDSGLFSKGEDQVSCLPCVLPTGETYNLGELIINNKADMLNDLIKRQKFDWDTLSQAVALAVIYNSTACLKVLLNAAGNNALKNILDLVSIAIDKGGTSALGVLLSYNTDGFVEAIKCGRISSVRDFQQIGTVLVTVPNCYPILKALIETKNNEPVKNI